MIYYDYFLLLILARPPSTSLSWPVPLPPHFLLLILARPPSTSLRPPSTSLPLRPLRYIHLRYIGLHRVRKIR